MVLATRKFEAKGRQSHALGPQQDPGQTRKELVETVNVSRQKTL
jgi:hypothetical protein